jgi:hypothetical protein
MNSPMTREANKLNSILSDFTEASGMTLNLDKSKLFFFNTPAAVQLHISRLLGIPSVSDLYTLQVQSYDYFKLGLLTNPKLGM